MTMNVINFTNRGRIMVESNSVLQVQGAYGAILSFQDGTVFGEAGVTRFLASAPSGASLDFSGTVMVNGTVELAGASAGGNSAWTGPGSLQWRSGSLAGFTFMSGFHAEMLTSGAKGFCGACTNQGTLRWTGDGALAAPCGATFNNSGLFGIETNGAWDSSIVFNNLPGGALRQTSGQFSLGTLNNAGFVEVDSGFLNVGSNFSSTANSTLFLPLGGYSAGTGFGRLSAQSLAPGGLLSVSLTNGFAPTNGSSFSVATSALETGQFSSALLPSLASNLTWRVSYASNGVTLKVVSPTMLTGARQGSNGSFRFTLAGSPGSSYVIQASTDLVQWATVETNALFSGTLTFTDTNANSFTRRFYRARILD